MIPRLIEHYRAQVPQLPALMAAEPTAARKALSELVGEIELTRDPDGAVWPHVHQAWAVPGGDADKGVFPMQATRL